MQFSSEESRSIATVRNVLEAEAAQLDPTSRVREMWEDVADVLAGHPSPFQHPWEHVTSALTA